MISAEEWEVPGFFGVEPKTEGDSPQPYNDLLYEIQRGENALSCAIAPAYKDVRIIVKENKSNIYELNAVGVDDVAFIEEAIKKEVLEIGLNDEESIRLVVYPKIEINHAYEDAI